MLHLRENLLLMVRIVPVTRLWPPLVPDDWTPIQTSRSLTEPGNKNLPHPSLSFTRASPMPRDLPLCT